MGDWLEEGKAASMNTLLQAALCQNTTTQEAWAEAVDTQAGL